MTTIAKGAELHLTATFYHPSNLTAAVDPDGYPESPRFGFLDGSGSPVSKCINLPFSRRVDKGVYSFNWPIPWSQEFLPAGTYTVRVEGASVGGTDLVDKTGAAFAFPVTIVDTPQTLGLGQRPYTTPDAIQPLIGSMADPVLPQEIAFAQQILDDHLKRSMWPTVYENKRYELPSDRNLIQLDITPVIRVYAAVPTDPVSASALLGRYTYGRRDRRVLNQVNYDYIAALAVFGSPPKFVPIDVTQIDLHPETGQIWLPTGFFLINYSQISITYEAGERTIPEAIIYSIAEIVDWIRFKKFSNLTQYSMGGVSRTMGDSFIPASVIPRVERWRVKTYR